MIVGRSDARLPPPSIIVQSQRERVFCLDLGGIGKAEESSIGHDSLRNHKADCLAGGHSRDANQAGRQARQKWARIEDVDRGERMRGEQSLRLEVGATMVAGQPIGEGCGLPADGDDATPFRLGGQAAATVLLPSALVCVPLGQPEDRESRTNLFVS